jgi:hypothetical protein
MAKFLKRDSADGLIKEEVTATAGGAPSANKVPELDASGRLAATMMPLGIGADTQVVLASEALNAGDFVNLYNNAGTLNARKADASNARQCDGFVNAAVANGANATVYLEGQNEALAALTPGSKYFLGVAGAISTVPASTAGHIHQYIGKALAATELVFEPDEPILLA